MSIIAFIDLARIVDEAGFPRGVPQATAIAVIAAESGRNTDAVNVNEGGSAPGSRDLGLWQLNDYWHPVGEDVAFDPVKSTEYAFKISAQGKNFSAWNAYDNGRYLGFMPEARVALDAMSRIRKLEATNKAISAQFAEAMDKVYEQGRIIEALNEQLDAAENLRAARDETIRLLQDYLAAVHMDVAQAWDTVNRPVPS